MKAFSFSSPVTEDKGPNPNLLLEVGFAWTYSLALDRHSGLENRHFTYYFVLSFISKGT